ncbi:hypothetical protein [Sulfurimonas sp.]|uniref:hypothetical protein n=1 Tax=Sulfurimonas sp. TaxID=2022749 RepID=UPI003564F4BF
MTTIKEINEEIQRLLRETDEDAIEEVKEKYEPFEKNMNSLLECEDLETYLEKYEQMHQEDEAVLKCFNLDTTEELKTYIEEKEIDLDALKTETVYASCEALKFAIYDSEEDDDY